jgi:hypothetical protein
LIHPAYIAGLTDGEGAIGINKRKKPELPRGYYYVVRVRISNNHRGALGKIQTQYGGTVGLNSNRPRPFLRVLHQNWQLELASRQAVKLLRDIQPYLIIKREQCELALAFAEHISQTRKPLSNEEWETRDAFYQKMLELNARNRGVLEPLSEGIAPVLRS